MEKLSIQVVTNTIMDQMKSVSEGVFEGGLMGTTIGLKKNRNCQIMENVGIKSTTL